MLKKRRTLFNLPAAALLLLLTTACQVPAAEFLLFYANDVHGETEPCG